MNCVYVPVVCILCVCERKCPLALLPSLSDLNCAFFVHQVPIRDAIFVFLLHWQSFHLQMSAWRVWFARAVFSANIMSVRFVLNLSVLDPPTQPERARSIDGHLSR